MADRVTIPAALLEEIRADLEAAGTRPSRWRPATTDEAPVVALAYGDGRAYGPVEPVGVIGTAYGNWPSIDYDPYLVLRSDDPVAATAWAPVGGVDDGPRPDVGDRVLVLADEGGDCPEPWIGHVTYAAWGNLPIGAVMSGGVTPLAAQESAVTRWAILPPEVPADPHALQVDGGAYELAIRIPMAAFTGAPNDDSRLDQILDLVMDLFPDAVVTGGPAWPEDGPTQCPTCGAVDRHERRHRAHEDAEGTLRELVRWLAAERERMRGMNNHRYDHQADAYSLVLDHLRDQGLDVDYLAEPDTREQT